MAERRKSFTADANWENNLVQYLYRPFDMRWLCYHSDVVELAREAIMRHMLAGENLALCVGRQGQVVGSGEWNLVFCSHTIEDVNLFYRGGNANFPLYLSPDLDAAQPDLFSALEPAERRPNLHPTLLPALAAAYGREPSPEEVFTYVYAVLYAPTYRERYAAFLRMDFPRVPFTAEAEVFAALSALGQRLVDLHLLRSPELDPPTCRFENIEADVQNPKSQIQNGIVGRGKTGLRYDPATERVYINATQSFGPVPPDVWAYQVGGYQVCEKWLKDRRERRLALDDIRAYCRIVTALGITLALQAEIDAVYAGVEAATVCPDAKTE